MDVQSFVAFDKTSASAPNALKYPQRALHEAMINALAHRDYETPDPTRITVFADRIEIVSPGSLPPGVSFEEFQAGTAAPKWRNQSLAWFLNRLQLAQAEGQGIPTILRTMREEGCPPPRFQANEARVTCVLPAHPRHALAREHRRIEQAISLGEFERAQKSVLKLLQQDPTNSRTVQLFAEVHRALNSAAPVRDFLKEHRAQLAPAVLSQLADVLTLAEPPSPGDFTLAREIYLQAAPGRVAERELRQLALGLSRAGADAEAIQLIDAQMDLNPELRDSPNLLRIRGNAYINHAKSCSQTGRRRDLPPQTKRRAWEDCRRYLSLAESDLRRALALSPDVAIADGIQRNLDFVDHLKKIAERPGRK